MTLLLLSEYERLKIKKVSKMSDRKLWSPSTTRNNINKFTRYINKEVNINTYEDLHRWSIEKKEIFWDNVWDFTQIIGQKKEKVFTNSKRFIDSKFFDQSTLNFAENCLQKNDKTSAIIFYNEQKISRRVTWDQLRLNVYKISHYFKSKNLSLIHI